jgi:hypothetical protein
LIDVPWTEILPLLRVPVGDQLEGLEVPLTVTVVETVPVGDKRVNTEDHAAEPPATPPVPDTTRIAASLTAASVTLVHPRGAEEEQM